MPSEASKATVLVVDDNPVVRDLCATSLRKAGYQVEVAADGREAQGYFGIHSNPIDLLITDIEMPFLSGIGLADFAAANGSRCRILLMSGHLPPPEIAQRGWPFLSKPFPPSVLVETVKELLSRTGRRPTAILAEDDYEMRWRLYGLLAREYDVVAVLEGGKSVLQKSEELHPDVIVLDISMPDMNGLEVARALQGSVPEIPIIFVTQRTDPIYVEAAFATGAAGYVAKTQAFTELNLALQKVRSGGQYLSAGLSPQVNRPPRV